MLVVVGGGGGGCGGAVDAEAGRAVERASLMEDVAAADTAAVGRVVGRVVAAAVLVALVHVVHTLVVESRFDHTVVAAVAARIELLQLLLIVARELEPFGGVCLSFQELVDNDALSGGRLRVSARLGRDALGRLAASAHRTNGCDRLIVGVRQRLDAMWRRCGVRESNEWVDCAVECERASVVVVVGGCLLLATLVAQFG